MMEIITGYSKNKKQESLLKSLLEEMKIRFEIGKRKMDNMILSAEDYYSRRDKSIKQAEFGKTRVLSKAEQKELWGL